METFSPPPPKKTQQNVRFFTGHMGTQEVKYHWEFHMLATKAMMLFCIKQNQTVHIPKYVNPSQ